MTINIFTPPKNKIIGAIRRIFSMSELYKYAKGRNLSEEKGPRGGKMVKCDGCGKVFPWSSTQLDHIADVIPLDRTAADMSYDEIIERMWCSPELLQTLCSECHDKKTKDENAIRKANKKRKKEADGAVSELSVSEN